MRAAQVDRAIHAWRLYAGASGRVNIKVEQRLYTRARQATQRIAKATGMSEAEVQRQLSPVVTARGPITPQPGRDY